MCMCICEGVFLYAFVNINVHACKWQGHMLKQSVFHTKAPSTKFISKKKKKLKLFMFFTLKNLYIYLYLSSLRLEKEVHVNLEDKNIEKFNFDGRMRCDISFWQFAYLSFVGSAFFLIVVPHFIARQKNSCFIKWLIKLFKKSKSGQKSMYVCMYWQWIARSDWNS